MAKLRNNYLKFISLITILLCIGGIITLAWMYIHRLRSFKVTYGRLNITDVIDANLLKVVQIDIDYLVDVPLENGHYTAILPFSIIAGYNLDNIRIQQKDNVLEVTLPYPKILTVDTDEDSGIKTLRSEGTENFYYIIKGFKRYGEKFAVKLAKTKYRILEKANKEISSVIKQMLSALEQNGTDIKIVTTPIDAKNQNETELYFCESKYQPVRIVTHDSRITVRSQDDPYSGEIFFLNNINGIKGNGLDLMRVRTTDISIDDAEKFLKQYKYDRGRFFDPARPDWKCWIKFNNGHSFSFFFTHENWIYKASIWSDNLNDFSSSLPEFLDLINNIQFVSKETQYQGKDIFGFLNKKNWESASIYEKRRYFWNFFTGGLSPGYGCIDKQHKNIYWSDAWPDVYLVDSDPDHLSEPFVILDEKGSEWYKDRPVKLQNKINTAINDSVPEELRSKVIAIIYNFNYLLDLHRDRFLIIFDDMIIYYIPPRMLLQKEIWKWCKWEDITIDNSGEISIDGEQINKNIESKALIDFLIKFIKYGFPAVYRE